jgi:pimeloyl-ACP methyl ester carboxylesterase
MADAEIVVLPGAGHVPMLTQPERVVAEIERRAAALRSR